MLANKGTSLLKIPKVSASRAVCGSHNSHSCSQWPQGTHHCIWNERFIYIYEFIMFIRYCMLYSMLPILYDIYMVNVSSVQAFCCGLCVCVWEPNNKYGTKIMNFKSTEDSTPFPLSHSHFLLPPSPVIPLSESAMHPFCNCNLIKVSKPVSDLFMKGTDSMNFKLYFHSQNLNFLQYIESNRVKLNNN